MIEERRRRICELLRAEGRVTVEALASRFGTSQVTIRADLSHPRVGRRADPHPRRRAQHAGGGPAAQRQAAAASQPRSCASPRPPPRSSATGETIILDSGTTTAEIARRIRTLRAQLDQCHHQRAQHRGAPDRRALGAAHHAGRHPASGVQLALRPHGRGGARDAAGDRLYLGADGIDPQIGVMTPHLAEAELNAKMIAIRAQVVVVADCLQVRPPQHLAHRAHRAGPYADHRPRGAGRGRRAAAQRGVDVRLV